MRANLKAPQFLKIERYAQRLSHRVVWEMEAPGDGLLVEIAILPARTRGLDPRERDNG